MAREPSLKPSLIRDAIGVRMDRPATISDAVEAFGGGGRGRSAVAQVIAGTTDKKSTAYKTALRNVQRWTAPEGKQHRQPTKLMPKIRSKLTTAVEKQRERQLASRLRGSLTVTWNTPLVHVSDEERERQDIQVRIPSSYLDEFREALEAGNEHRAVKALATATMAAWFDVPYGEAEGEITEASGLTIHGLS